jgi:hypothetical protein
MQCGDAQRPFTPWKQRDGWRRSAEPENRQSKRIKPGMKVEMAARRHLVRVQRTERIAHISILPDGPLNAARLVVSATGPTSLAL